MNTKQFFSINRFWLLLRNDMMINYKKYLLNIGGAFVVFFIIIYMTLPTNPDRGDYEAQKYAGAFVITLFGLGGFIGMAFPFLGEKRQMSVYLLTPASTFEKYLSQFLIRFIGGIVIFLSIFYIDAFIARQAAMQVLAKYPNAPSIAPMSFYEIINSIANLKHASGYGEPLSIMSFFIIISFYLFTIKVFFNKNGFIKTLLSGTAISFAIILLNYGIVSIFLPEHTLIYYKVNNQFYNLQLWITALGCATPVFLLPLGYFKLKEKQL